MERLELDPLCWTVGMTTGYPDRQVPDATKLALLAALGIDPDTRPGEADVPDFHADPASAGTCYLPDWLAEHPTWGLFCQLYELRSDRSWGIGDFADLARIAEIAGEAGADFVGVNPVHALFLADPDRTSPFTPSNRRFLNPLYIAMDDLPGKTRPDKAALAAVQATDLVDYPGVAALKRKGLRAVYGRRPFDGARYPKADFEAFRAAGGQALERHALFEALSQEMVEAGHGAGWTDWPEPYRDPESPAVARFARHHDKRVQFHLWMQWIATRQLAEARSRALSAGLRIGLYLDLAVGEAPDGSATWSAPGLTMRGVSVGAPPDVFAQEGQYWALAALSPTALAAADYAPFRALISAQLDHAGALRIDHVMALRQLFLVPEGESPMTGTHLAYPIADMLRVVAEESRAHGSVMIGEDLGWVPEGFRGITARANILAYRILYFEQEWGFFQRSSTYPETALACISTHDLPTLAHWWEGEDIAERQRFGLIDAETAGRDIAKRGDERVALVNAFIDGGQLPPDAQDHEAEMLPDRLLAAAYHFLAETPCRLVGVRLADLVGPKATTNVPGTTDEHPNWQRRAAVSIDQIAETQAFQEIASVMREVRPRG